MSRRGLWLFITVGLAWGLPYFFIRIALDDFSTSSIIFLRVVIGAALLVPIAYFRKALLPALKAWPWVFAFAAIEMIGPWWLITEAEKHISSGLTGLLVATVPFFAVPIAYFYIKDRSVLHPKTLLGLVIGFGGVFLLVGIDSVQGAVNPLWVGAVILASLGYALAPAIASKQIGEVPTVGVIALSLVMVSIAYAPAALFDLPKDLAQEPSISGWLAIVVLGLICSAVAFLLFFELIREIGSARATLITYLNTAVALVLGIAFLAEPITLGLLLGMPLVLVGSYLAGRRHS